MDKKIENYKLKELQRWYRKSPGQVLKKLINDEIARYKKSNRGKNALYIGLADFKLKFKSKYHLSYLIFDNLSFDKHLESFKKLPFEDKSHDDIVLIHALDCTENPYEFIREINRIATDDASITLIGFNKTSLWGLIRPYMKKETPWVLNFHSLYNINEWFKLLGYKTTYRESISFFPILSHRFSKLMEKVSFLQRIFFRSLGGIYFCSFKKEVIATTPIKVKFTDKYVVAPFKKSTLNRIK